MEADPFVSILFPTAESMREPLRNDPPDFFKDLHLTDLIGQAAVDRAGADLRAYYYTMLRDTGVIRYRQEVLRELEIEETRKAVSDFAVSVFEVRHFLGQFHDSYSQPEVLNGHPLEQGKLLHSAVRYCRAVESLMAHFQPPPPFSEGLRRFFCFLKSLTEESGYKEFSEETHSLRARMDAIEYCIRISGNTVRVEKYSGQEDFAIAITALFEKFRQGEVQDYRHRLHSGPYCEETEEGILNLVRNYYPDEFKELAAFTRTRFRFEEPLLLEFSNEVQFYLRWLNFIHPLRQSGLSFCIPEITLEKDRLFCNAGFDLALAKQLFGRTVPNDFLLEAPERLTVITGPNQGGKTTFTRAFGQMHYLAALGLSVPGKSARLFLCEKILTHFEREEDLASENGKLRDDLVRLKLLLDQTDEKSLVLINEIFASTTADDALLLGRKMMSRLISAGSLGIIVTFLDELADTGPETVSMMSLVSEDENRTRTFKIQRKAPDGLAYALQIAARHGLTESQLKQRLREMS